MELVHCLLSQTHSVYTVKIIDILIISLINRITLTAGSLRPESQNTAECLQSFMASCDFLIKQSLSWRTKANFMWGWSIIIDWCHVVASRPMIKSAQWGNHKTDIAAGSLKSVILPFIPVWSGDTVLPLQSKGTVPPCQPIFVPPNMKRRKTLLECGRRKVADEGDIETEWLFLVSGVKCLGRFLQLFLTISNLFMMEGHLLYRYIF